MKVIKVIKTIFFYFGIILLLGSSASFICAGLYYQNLEKTSTIVGEGIDNVSNFFKKYVSNSLYKNINDNFTLNGNIKMNYLSEYYYKNSSLDVESYKINNKLKNLSNTTTTFQYIHDRQSKQKYFSLNEQIKEEPLVIYKKLCKDSTDYFKLNDLGDKYINDGNCNYFESLSEENTLKSNIEYVYDTTVNALKNNLSDKYFDKNETEIRINNKNKKVYRYTLRITNRNIKEIINGIQKDLKEDELAYKIINNTNPDFFKDKLVKEMYFVGKEESYTLNIYTTKLTYQPIKYEFIHINGEEKEVYSYEGDNKEGKINVVKQDEFAYEINLEYEKGTIKGTIIDKNDKEIGKIIIDKTKTSREIFYSKDDGISKYELTYTSKFDNIKNKEFDNVKKIYYKHVENNEIIINEDIEIKLNVLGAATIQEELGEPILKSTLKENEISILETKKEKLKERLEK